MDKALADRSAFGFSVHMVGLQRPLDVGRFFVVVGPHQIHMTLNRLAILPIVQEHSPPHKQAVYLKIQKNIFYLK